MSKYRVWYSTNSYFMATALYLAGVDTCQCEDLFNTERYRVGELSAISAVVNIRGLNRVRGMVLRANTMAEIKSAVDSLPEEMSTEPLLKNVIQAGAKHSVNQIRVLHVLDKMVFDKMPEVLMHFPPVIPLQVLVSWYVTLSNETLEYKIAQANQCNAVYSEAYMSINVSCAEEKFCGWADDCEFFNYWMPFECYGHSWPDSYKPLQLCQTSVDYGEAVGVYIDGKSIKPWEAMSFFSTQLFLAPRQTVFARLYVTPEEEVMWSEFLDWSESKCEIYKIHGTSPAVNGMWNSIIMDQADGVRSYIVLSSDTRSIRLTGALNGSHIAYGIVNTVMGQQLAQLLDRAGVQSVTIDASWRKVNYLEYSTCGIMRRLGPKNLDWSDDAVWQEQIRDVPWVGCKAALEVSRRRLLARLDSVSVDGVTDISSDHDNEAGMPDTVAYL